MMVFYHVATYIYVCICMYTCVYVCMYDTVCTYVYVYVHMCMRVESGSQLLTRLTH